MLLGLAEGSEQWLAIAHSQLAKTYVASGEHEGAIPHFSEQLRLAPHDPDGYYGTAICLLRLGTVAEALHHFEKAVELGHDLADVYVRSYKRLLEESSDPTTPL